MSNNPLGLNRDQLSKALGGNYAVIRAFEQLQLDASSTPSTVEEAAAAANSALALAGQAISVLAEVASLLEQIATVPVPLSMPQDDVYVPALALPTFGSMAEQDSGAVSITGGALDGVQVAADAFACNGATPQATYPIGSAATDLPTVIALANKIRIALIANGIAS